MMERKESSKRSRDSSSADVALTAQLKALGKRVTELHTTNGDEAVDRNAVIAELHALAEELERIVFNKVNAVDYPAFVHSGMRLLSVVLQSLRFNVAVIQRALCALSASIAYLAPLGPAASASGPASVAAPSSSVFVQLVDLCVAPEACCDPVAFSTFCGRLLAVGHGIIPILRGRVPAVEITLDPPALVEVQGPQHAVLVTTTILTILANCTVHHGQYLCLTTSQAFTITTMFSTALALCDESMASTAALPLIEAVTALTKRTMALGAIERAQLFAVIFLYSSATASVAVQDALAGLLQVLLDGSRPADRPLIADAIDIPCCEALFRLLVESKITLSLARQISRSIAVAAQCSETFQSRCKRIFFTNISAALLLQDPSSMTPVVGVVSHQDVHHNLVEAFKHMRNCLQSTAISALLREPRSPPDDVAFITTCSALAGCVTAGFTTPLLPEHLDVLTRAFFALGRAEATEAATSAYIRLLQCVPRAELKRLRVFDYISDVVAAKVSIAEGAFEQMILNGASFELFEAHNVDVRVIIGWIDSIVSAHSDRVSPKGWCALMRAQERLLRGGGGPSSRISATLVAALRSRIAADESFWGAHDDHEASELAVAAAVCLRSISLSQARTRQARQKVVDVDASDDSDGDSVGEVGMQTAITSGDHAESSTASSAIAHITQISLTLVEDIDDRDAVKGLVAACGQSSADPRVLAAVTPCLPLLGKVGGEIALRLLRLVAEQKRHGSFDALATVIVPVAAHIFGHELAFARAVTALVVVAREEGAESPPLDFFEELAAIAGKSRRCGDCDELCAVFVEHLLDHFSSSRLHIAAALRATTTLLQERNWQLDDVVRVRPGILRHAALDRLCECLELEFHDFFAKNWDIILPDLIIEDRRDEIKALTSIVPIEKHRAIPVPMAAVMARVLMLPELHTDLGPSGEASNSQNISTALRKLDVVARYFSKPSVAHLPTTIERQLEFYIIALMSPNVCIPSRLPRALLLLTSLAKTDANERSVERALYGGRALASAQEVVVKCIFDVVDRVTISLGLEFFGPIPGEKERARSEQASLATKVSWLRALKGLLTFMGPTTDIIGAKIPTILTECAKTREFWDVVSELWHALVESLTTDYLCDNGPSIAVDMISFEQRGVGGEALATLTSALKLLLHKTASAPFWTIFGSALRTNSSIIRCAFPQTQARHIAEIILGCAEGLASSSARCREVFVRGLKSVLDSLSIEEHKTMAKDAGCLIQPLLRCCRDDEATSEVALVCLGLIGAKSFATAESIVTAQERFQAQHVLKWDLLVFVILDTYCSAALGATSDPTLHDRAAFAIQTLLVTCANQERRKKLIPELVEGEEVSTTELSHYSWWRNLSKDKQSAFTAFTTTKFATKIVQANDRKTPEYHEGMPFAEWAWYWFRNVVSRTTNIHGKIFESVRNVAKRDIGLCLFLLPHLVVNVVLFGQQRDAEDIYTEIETVLRSRSGEEHIQQIFVIFDCAKMVQTYLRRGSSGTVDPSVARDLARRLEEFVGRVQWKLYVDAAIRAKCFARALMVIESPPSLPSVGAVLLQSINLQEIFARLEDKDSSKVVHAHADHRDWAEAALSHEQNGEFAQAVQCCELHLQQQQDDGIAADGSEASASGVEHHLCALRSMRQLGQLHLMISYAKSLVEQVRVGTDPAKLNGIATQASEAAWRLGKWDTLDALPSANSNMGTALLQLQKFRLDQASLKDVFKATARLRKAVHSSLLSSCKESYDHAFPHLVTLHATCDVDMVAKLMAHIRAGRGDASTRKLDELCTRLDNRLNLIHHTEPAREVVISLHRVIYTMLQHDERAAAMSIEYAKLLRDSGHLQAALNAVRQVDHHVSTPHGRRYHRLEAQLLWMLGEKQSAVAFALKHARDERLPASARASLLLQATTWRQLSSSDTTQTALTSFRQVLELAESEEAHFELAMFLDKNFTTIRNRITASADARGTKCKAEYLQACDDYLVPLLHHFATSLTLGREKLFTSLPRLLQRWLDTSLFFQQEGAPTKNLTALHDCMTKHLTGPNALSPSVLIAALPQIVSRLGHPRQETLTLLARVVTTLLQAFPQQTLWSLLPLVYSASSKSRSEFVSNNILKSFELWARTNHSDPRLLERARAIFNCLIDICNAPATQFTDHVRLTQLQIVKKVIQLITNSKFILPTQHTLTPRIPMSTADEASFPVEPTFNDFDDRVDIMSSIQKPKKICILANTGERVHFLCKAKDEPRKDMRMMELAALMNNVFQQSVASQHRRFALRRYAVTALQDDCGIIEWVNNTTTLRSLCDEVYHQRGLGLKITQLKDIKEDCDRRKLSKVDVLVKSILPHFPPSLHVWLQQAFHQPSQWYDARVAFTQSAALWSMVGHVVGLGDRHGENLLIDFKRGEIVHVDFASLFDAAEKLTVPERVRFRLTQNLTDVMGITGYNGPFRSCCEIALQTQVEHRDALMGVLETFLHDPLVEWAKQRADNTPKTIFRRVGRRLDGFLDLLNEPIEPIALNIEGQVEKLIVHCSSNETLAEMYFWWMPWI